jgi:hypothetical protein
MELPPSYKSTLFSELRKILCLNPSVVKLMKDMIQVADLRVSDLPIQDQNSFTTEQTETIHSIWRDYLKTLGGSETNFLSSGISFYKDAYYSILNIFNSCEKPSNQRKQQYSEEIAHLQYIINAVANNTMNFVLNKMRPWQQLDQGELQNFFINDQYPINSTTVTKHLCDKVLVKILNDSKDLITEFRNQTKQTSENALSIDFKKGLDLLITSYEELIANDDTVNYIFQLKKINEIINYFLSILDIQNDSSLSFMPEIVDSQLENIKIFTKSRADISKLIESYVNFNFSLKEFNCTLCRKFSKTTFC